MSREDLIEVGGIVTEMLAGGHVRVQGDNGQQYIARIGGKLRRSHIKVIPGDHVTVAVSPYDPSHGLIVHRG